MKLTPTDIVWAVIGAMLLTSGVVSGVQYIENTSRDDYARGCYEGLRIADHHDQESSNLCALKAGYGVRP